jgi:hypothetical protein
MDSISYAISFLNMFSFVDTAKSYVCRYDSLMMDSISLEQLRLSHSDNIILPHKRASQHEICNILDFILLKDL